MSENRPNLRRRMGSFVAKPEPGELHVIQAYHLFIMVSINCVASFIYKLHLKVLHGKDNMNQVRDISSKMDG